MLAPVALYRPRPPWPVPRAVMAHTTKHDIDMFMDPTTSTSSALRVSSVSASHSTSTVFRMPQSIHRQTGHGVLKRTVFDLGNIIGRFIIIHMAGGCPLSSVGCQAMLHLLIAGVGAYAKHYHLDVVSHAPTPVLSSSNAAGHGRSDCLIFNPSVVTAQPPVSNRSGLLVRECCGRTCEGHGRRLLATAEPPQSVAHAERISFADCDLAAGTCSDPDPAFNLDPTADTEDPRGLWGTDGFFYLFYYRGPPSAGSACVGSQCTVQLSRTQTPTVAGSYERIAVLPWHRNGCCIVRPAGQTTVCMWGEGPSPFPGLGISTTTNLSSGLFTQVPWKLGVKNATSPTSADGMWLLPLGADQSEVKLEAGTHIHELSTGDLLTFYAAATPGWVANGNYTVGWLILDGNEPTRILQRSATHVLIPTMDYETLCNGAVGCKYHGERKNVIFACTAMPTGREDEFRLYFGGGDGNVGTAVIQVSYRQ